MKAARSTFARYLMFEIPGWVVAAVVLVVLVQQAQLPARTAWILFALFVAKDFALYPLLRVGYQRSAPDGAASLVGALGTARERLDPEGWVRVGAELWRAELAHGQAPVEAGGAVRVVKVDALTLHVERA